MYRWARSTPKLLRRGVAALSLAGFLAAIVGVPVLHPFFGPDGKDLSQPFPCIHSHCGCQSAEGCWRGCCCHTNRQKLAWADAHGVQPPEYVAAAAAAEESPAACASGGSCCAAAAHPASCCESSEVDWPLLPALAARKCHGLPQLWLLLSTATPTAPRFQWQPVPFQSGRIVLLSDASISQSPRPDKPPPRA